MSGALKTDSMVSQEILFENLLRLAWILAVSEDFFKWLKEHSPKTIIYRNISAREEPNQQLFFKGLLLAAASFDLTVSILGSTMREISLFYIKGYLKSEVLSHCLKSQSLFKNPDQVPNYCTLTLRVAFHQVLL